MIPLRLGTIDGATPVRGDPALAISAVVCDSRRARPGALFVCLRGSRHDGHAFVAYAAARGTVAALGEPGRGHGLGRLAVLEADSPLAVLAAIGRAVRRRSHARIVGIAGSAGKTSTKDALLAPRGADHRDRSRAPAVLRHGRGRRRRGGGADRRPARRRTDRDPARGVAAGPLPARRPRRMALRARLVRARLPAALAADRRRNRGHVAALLRPGDVVLVKASRAAGLDRLVHALAR